MLDISENAMLAELSNATRANTLYRPETPEQNQAVPVRMKQDSPPGNAALKTLLALALTDSDDGRAMAELIPPELLLSGQNPLAMALNIAINAALNDEFDSLNDELKNFLIEHPSPEVSKILFAPAAFPAAKRQRAMQDAVNELFRCHQKQSESSLLERLRTAATDEEKMKILMDLQNSNNQQERKIME